MDRSRSDDLVDHDILKSRIVVVVGSGAVGSNLVYLLAKLGVGTINVYDDDIVSPENIEPQFYKPSDVPDKKVTAIVKNVLEFVDDVSIVPGAFRWNGTEEEFYNFNDDVIVVSAVDSHESREAIAKTLAASNWWEYYFDCRMGSNVVELYHVTPPTLTSEAYTSSILDDHPMEIPCSMRSVAYNGMFLASLAAREVVAAINGEPVPYHIKFDMLGWLAQIDLQIPPDML